MTTVVVNETRETLVRRRETLLADLGMTLEEFAVFARTRSLTATEFEAREELEEIAFLLGE